MMKRMQMLILLVVAIAVGASGTFMLVRGGKDSGKATAAELPTKSIPLEARTVNLADASGGHYLRAALVLVVTGEGKIEGVASERNPELMDCMISTLSKQTYAILLSAEGRQQLKETLREGFSKELEGTGWKVKEVLFTDFVME